MSGSPAKNCLILGSGRSGTSMLAGILSRSGYFMGENFRPGSEANPKGFFEDKEINRINEEMLAPVTPRRPDGALGRFFRHRPLNGQRWVAAIPLGVAIRCPEALTTRIAAQTARAPFCFKDPRFCYTLPAWRPFLSNVVFICIFREPGRTAQSIVKACGDLYPRREVAIAMDRPRALQVWALMYRHVLEAHRYEGEWLFVHYDQVLNGAALPRIEQALGLQADRQFAEERLKRSADHHEIPAEAARLYDQLCQLAGYTSGSPLASRATAPEDAHATLQRRSVAG